MAEKIAEKVLKTEAEWKKQLTDEQYHVTREAGTECAFTGKYWNTKEDSHWSFPLSASLHRPTTGYRRGPEMQAGKPDRKWPDIS